MSRAQHDKARKLVTKLEAQKIDRSTFEGALKAVLKKEDPVSACALIDSITPLGAAIILSGLAIKGQAGNKHAAAILKRAMKLKIRGTQGAVRERNELFKQTGILLV